MEVSLEFLEFFSCVAMSDQVWVVFIIAEPKRCEIVGYRSLIVIFQLPSWVSLRADFCFLVFWPTTNVLIFMLGWPCIICKYFVSFPTWYTFISLIYLQFSSYNFLYMFRTVWSIIRRIKLHVQPLAPFPRSLLSRAWPLVLTHQRSRTR